MPTLFFMPWTYVKVAGYVGPISFVPYERVVSPRSAHKTNQKNLDAIIWNYADRAIFQNALQRAKSIASSQPGGQRTHLSMR